MEGLGVSCAIRLVGLYEISARAGKKADGLRQRLGVVPCYIPPRRRLTTATATLHENRPPLMWSYQINLTYHDVISFTTLGF